MSHLSVNLKKLLENSAVSPSTLSKHSGVDKPRISRLLSGKTTNPQIDTLRPIAKFLGVTINQLIGDSPLPSDEGYDVVVPINRLLVPLIAWKLAPHWLAIKSQFEPEHTIYVRSKASTDAYALRVDMDQSKLKFPRGTVIIVDPNLMPQSRDYIVIKKGDTVALRQIIIEKGSTFFKTLCTPITMEAVEQPLTHFGVVIESHIEFSRT